MSQLILKNNLFYTDMADVEHVLPYGNDEEKGKQVQRMFDKIAQRYDRLNSIMSMGMHKGWRRKSVDYLKQFPHKRILDIASGTGDLAIEMKQRLDAEVVIGSDLSEEMMSMGLQKAARVGDSQSVTFEFQDCMQLTYPDSSFDIVTAAFGVRNFNNPGKGISEMYRVLHKGGHIMILELSTPKWFPMNSLYYIYSSFIIPMLGSIFSIDKSAYKYLPASIKAMPQGSEMIGLLAKNGFENTSYRTFTGGVCSMYTGVKT
jgi:demethylmenaquinone methyltransferase/2-methoxy-6-polyprenyl-1,4-benzoquinol methylase